MFRAYFGLLLLCMEQEELWETAAWIARDLGAIKMTRTSVLTVEEPQERNNVYVAIDATMGMGTGGRREG